MDAQATPQLPSLGEMTRIFGKVGLLSFGGPAAQIALMHRLLVDEKRWIGERRFLHALNYCMLLPGPEAQQLATYVGWLMHGTKGGLIAGLLFIVPGALVMLALSMLYAAYAEIPLIVGVFYGIKCAVLAIVVQALLRVAGRALKTTLLRAIALIAFLALFLFGLPFPLVILAAGIAGFVASRVAPQAIAGGAGHKAHAGSPEYGLIDALIDNGHLTHIAASHRVFWLRLTAWTALWLAPVAIILAALGPHDVFADLGLFFSKMAVVTFGGAYAVLSYVAQEAVQTYRWLTAPEMVDGLGLAETTPGPLILVLQFVGFLAAFRAATGLDPLLAGVFGATVTLWATFVPSFLFIFVGAPYAEALRQRPGLSAALTAITAAVVGVIANLALWFALHVLFGRVGHVESAGLHMAWPDWASLDLVACALAAAAMVLALRNLLGVATLVALFGAAGLALSALHLV
ncbi:MAG: chromate efflux transporter [Alphaproteobacteria bacterium]|nr:chromate efflux transporter [Alphaproteobacteria bacterium]